MVLMLPPLQQGLQHLLVDLTSALSGIGTLKGELHGGANEEAVS